MYYRGKLNSLNIQIKVKIKLHNKHYELGINIWYNKVNNIVSLYFRCLNYYNRQIKTNK